jgi:CSLREA domain-containing protein
MRDSNNPLAKGWPMGARCLVAAALAAAGLGLLAAPAAAGPHPISPPVVTNPLPPPVINTTVDQSLGDCSVTCSLRDAIALSAAGATLAVPAGHYVLTLGDITITQSLTLAGAGARTTVIDGNSTSGGPTGGIFNITVPSASCSTTCR